MPPFQLTENIDLGTYLNICLLESFKAKDAFLNDTSFKSYKFSKYMLLPSFRWSSKPLLFSIFILGYSLLIDTLTILRTIQTGLTYYNTGNFDAQYYVPTYLISTKELKQNYLYSYLYHITLK